MFTNLVHLFKTAQDAAERAYGNVLAAEKEAFADLGAGYTAMNTRSSYATERELQEFCSRLTGRLVMEASRKFAPGSGRLDIDKDAELKRFGLDVGKVLEAGKLPDLDGFWQHLEKTYAGDAGREVAFSQAAKAIINGFWLKPDSQIKRTSSAVVLEKRVSSEVSFRSSGKRRIHYGSTQTLALTFDGLATFAFKHEFGALGQHLKHCNVSDLEFETRQKMSFNGLDVVMFNDKWQFKFSHQVGDALSLFVSEYGAEHLASRDRY
ncbi:class 1 isoprenoid biosynthesis enzyme [Burkholderia sp. PAMC 26561]|uniref:class 1 isoprenoid biosynthesis enzyme n=1 Tax=Burkholderia sp. PAMC 26561 TaxID=1795043 RepID=UPI00076B2F1F|nr:class 1 isoprenoid biosynthesis enzyme [Burkholderia sp. PAMC 26561]AME28587.1 hypothetical protein AXG89_32865 [Burkholderia sp. PAMC 26561]